MRRRLHVGATRELRQVGNKVLAGGAACDVASKKLKAAAGRERCADLRQCRGVARQVEIVNHGRAEVNLPRLAVSYDRDGRQITEVVLSQETGDLLQAVARRIDDESLGGWCKTLEKFLKVRNVEIDEDDLLRRDIIRHEPTPGNTAAPTVRLQPSDSIIRQIALPPTGDRPCSGRGSRPNAWWQQLQY